MEDMVYTVEETAKILRCSKDYIYELIKKGLLPTLKIPKMRIRKSALEAFLAKWEGYDLSKPESPVRVEEAHEKKAV